ncbi:hypothetical protein GSQ54_08150 [Clostridioides difficile]|nr:hypothetical protein [Clostridioides difficile]
MNTKNLNISPLKLLLDINNPRFIISSNASQKDIVEYLIKNENVIDLAKGINSNKDLLPGERIVVVKENNDFVVVEGNRRTCACKLLLDNSTWPKKYDNKKFEISSDTLNNLESIQVDLVSSREEALSIMGTKHISGIKTWSPYSKMNFFANLFDNGKPVKFISELTSVSEAKIKTQLKEFKIINYTLKLSLWSEEEREKLLNLENINLSIFTKALTLKSDKLKASCKNMLKLTYHDDTFEPITELPKKIFDDCLYEIAKKSFDDKNNFSTRSKLDDISEFIHIIDTFYSTSDLDINAAPKQLNEKDTLINTNSDKYSNVNPTQAQNTIHSKVILTNENSVNNEDKVNKPNKFNTNNIEKKFNRFNRDNISNPDQHHSIHQNKNGINNSNIATTRSKEDNKYIRENETSWKRKSLIPKKFKVKISDTRVNNLYKELKDLDIENYLNMAAISFRVLIELSLDVFINNFETGSNENDKLKNKIQKILTYLKNEKLITESESKPINISISNQYNILSTTTLNAYVHNCNIHPDKQTLLTTWDNIERFFEIIWNQIENKK